MGREGYYDDDRGLVVHFSRQLIFSKLAIKLDLTIIESGSIV